MFDWDLNLFLSFYLTIKDNRSKVKGMPFELQWASKEQHIQYVLKWLSQNKIAFQQHCVDPQNEGGNETVLCFISSNTV
jgi:hypothetical protein